MVLLLDIGNTRLKWAMLQDGEIQQGGEISHKRNPDAAAVGLIAVLNSVERQSLERILAANVAGKAAADAICSAVLEYTTVAVEFARTEAEAGGIRNGYRDHRQLGIDRWMAIRGAFEQYQTALCIVDVGTAVTIDMVDATGRHHGGVILPGFELMKRTLDNDTSDIKKHAETEVSLDVVAGPARDTAGAVRSGAILAIIGAVERCWRLVDQPNANARLVVTGGDADLLRNAFGTDAIVRPRLVLEGLALLASSPPQE